MDGGGYMASFLCFEWRKIYFFGYSLVSEWSPLLTKNGRVLGSDAIDLSSVNGLGWEGQSTTVLVRKLELNREMTGRKE